MKESAPPTSATGPTMAPGVPRPTNRRVDQPPVYLLGSDAAERTRLQRQSDGLREETLALLAHVPIPSGARALDLGCGPSGALELLSQKVGPTGQVTGVDINSRFVELANQLMRDKGLGNVSVQQGDARHTGLSANSFDIVHTRLVLVNVPDPEDVVVEMAHLVRPGGWLASLEGEPLVNFVYPPHPAWDRLTEIFEAACSSDGVDPRTGRRVPELFRRAGLMAIGSEVKAGAVPAGHTRRTLHADIVRAVWSKVVARGIASQSELEELDRQVRRHLANPETVAVSNLWTLTWAQRPIHTP